MKDHEKREIVNELTAIARDYGKTQQLRDRIAHCVLDAIDLAVAAEREECAMEADRQGKDETYGHAAFRCANIAAEIRARVRGQSE